MASRSESSFGCDGCAAQILSSILTGSAQKNERIGCVWYLLQSCRRLSGWRGLRQSADLRILCLSNEPVLAFISSKRQMHDSPARTWLRTPRPRPRSMRGSRPEFGQFRARTRIEPHRGRIQGPVQEFNLICGVEGMLQMVQD
jgi:hypothetical protein